MPPVAIQVENLSKRYRIGVQEHRPDTLAGALTKVITGPVRNFKRLHRLTSFDETDQSQDDVIWALKDVSFEVQEGEVIGVIGLNGSGKTTLLKVLSRITEPTSGRATTIGRVSSLLEIGTGFHPELTGRENTYLNGTILGMRRKEIDKKFGDIVEFSGVEKFIDTPVKRYSSGMSVRLAFAVAAHLEPHTLLVDEVLAVGDVRFQQKCLAKMGDIARSGTTVLFVSHNMGSISTLCEKAIFLSQGSLQYMGSARDAVSTYLASAAARTDLKKSWDFEDAPGSPQVKIKSAAIGDQHGNQNLYLPTTEPVTVTIEYWVLQEDSSITVGFWLFDAAGNAIFSAGNLEEVREAPQVEKGLHRATCLIPKNLLNSGTYMLTVGAYINIFPHPTPMVEIPACVSFEAVDDHRVHATYDHWPSLIKPDLEWKSSMIGELEEAGVGCPRLGSA